MSFNMCILNHNLLGLSDFYQLNLHYAVQRFVHHSEVPDLGDIKTGTICIPILEKHKCRTQYLVFLLQILWRYNFDAVVPISIVMIE